ncbi:MAG: anti-sigma factor [Candidatus Nanopelagicales bacterium]
MNGSSERNGDAHTLTAAYALDALDDIERKTYERHLASCATCTEELRGFRQTTARLGLVTQSQPPESLRARILTAAAGVPQERPTAISKAHTSRGLSATRWLSAAAAVLLVTTGALGVTAYSNAQKASDLSATASSVAAVLSAPDAQSVQGRVSGGGTGSVVVSRDRGEAVFVTAGLAQPPSGTTYQLWAVDDAGAAKPNALLSPKPDGTAGDVVPWPAEATTLGLTLEPAGGSQQPTTDPILLLDLNV